MKKNEITLKLAKVGRDQKRTPAGAEKAMYRALGVLQTGDSEALYV
jgi:hypothetical protein